MLNQLAIFPSLNVWVICGYEAFVQKSSATICYDSALSQFGEWPTCLNNSLSPFFLKFTSVYLSTQRDSSVLRLLVSHLVVCFGRSCGKINLFVFFLLLRLFYNPQSRRGLPLRLVIALYSWHLILFLSYRHLQASIRCKVLIFKRTLSKNAEIQPIPCVIERGQKSRDQRNILDSLHKFWLCLTRVEQFSASSPNSAAGQH